MRRKGYGNRGEESYLDPVTRQRLAELDAREEAAERRNRRKNRPITAIVTLMILVFGGMIGFMIYFQTVKSESVVANSANQRQDAFSDFVVRGNIESRDGEILAETETSEDGTDTRVYPCGNVFSHVVGFDKYGNSGIEQEENFALMRSHVGIVSQFRNSLNGVRNPGDNVVTTLDGNLQQVASDALGSMTGAIVAIRPDTGEILAMVSKPDFDPNQIDAVWNNIHSEEGAGSTVLLNRASQGLYAPGSTFKVLTTMEYLSEHPTDYQNYSYTCTGSGIFNSVAIHCSGERAHGTEDLAESLANSCNTSFSNLGTTLDMDRLHALAEKAYYNQSIPFELDTSKSSFVVDGSTDPSQIPQTVIGQGDTQITPLHNAMIMCAVANQGVLMKPYLVDRIETADGITTRRTRQKTCRRIFDSSDVSILIPMLQGVCEHGTAARNLAGKPYTCAGKTGTAETDSQGHLNSWFIGFSNVSDPDLVVSVVVENYDQTGVSGSYLAGQIFDAYYAEEGD